MMIDRLQEAMSRFPQAQLETRHYWADGMYCRELFRPATTLIVGKVHKKEHFLIVAAGTLRIIANGQTTEVTGPAIIVSPPGTQRATYAITDATVITVHKTACTNLNDIDADLVEDDPKSMYLPGNILKALT